MFGAVIDTVISTPRGGNPRLKAKAASSMGVIRKGFAMIIPALLNSPVARKLMKGQVDQVLELYPLRLGVALDQVHTERVHGIGLCHSVLWCTDRCTEEPLAIALPRNDYLQFRQEGRQAHGHMI